MSIIEFFQNPVAGIIGIFGALVFSFICSLFWEYIKEGRIGADIWKRFIMVFLIITLTSSLLINVLVLVPSVSSDPTPNPTSTPTVTNSSTSKPTPIPTPTPAPTPTPTPTPEPLPTTVIVPFGETYEFSTQIKFDGTARITAQEGETFETIHFALTMVDHMLPSDFAAKWGSVYKLQGTEAGAGFQLLLKDYVGTAAIVPQNIIKTVFQSESGNTENPGFQLMDAEIAGNTDVVLTSNVPKTLWKRYTFTNAGEEMKYLAVTTYNDGDPRTIYFELKSSALPTLDPKDIYRSLTLRDKGDDVVELQRRLIELGYLSAYSEFYGHELRNDDGLFGEETFKAVRTAQGAYGMDKSGIATPEFQAKLFSTEQPDTINRESNATHDGDDGFFESTFNDDVDDEGFDSKGFDDKGFYMQNTVG